MMLSKATSEDQQQEQEETLQRPTPLPTSLVKKKTAEDAMADLERRLQMLGSTDGDSAATASTTGSGMTNHTTAAAVAPATAASHAAAAAMPSKSALLVSVPNVILYVSAVIWIDSLNHSHSVFLVPSAYGFIWILFYSNP
jgi:hypothetical protein